MLLLVDNSKDLSTAQMTPRLIEYLHSKNKRVSIASDHSELATCLKSYRITGIVLSGGPLLLSERNMVDHYSHNITALLHAERCGVPVLGICFGMQVMASVYGGKVGSLKKKRHGYEQVVPVDTAQSNIVGPGRMFVSHQDRVIEVPPGFQITSTSAGGQIIQSMEDCAHYRYGVQFHPEGSSAGEKIVDAFLRICSARPT